MNARTHTVFRFYQLFSGISFSGPIWAVYLLSRGLTLTEFGVVEATLHVGMLAAQVPTGALADSWGRRRMLVVAGFFTAVGELGYVLAPSFGLICLAGAIQGVSFALKSGTDEAYLFDSLAHDDAQAQFPRMLGGLWAVFQFATAISYVMGGLIATVWSRPAAFGLTAGCALVASAIALRLPRDDRAGVGSGVHVARRGLAALRHSPRLLALTLGWSFYWAAGTAWFFYAGPFFEGRGADDTELGLILGGAMLLSAGFSWVGGHIGEKTPFALAVGLTTVVAAVGLALGATLPGLLLPVLALIVVAGTPELVYVSISTYLQHNTRSEFRATSMSIAEGFFSIQMLWLFPLVGWLIQHQSYEVGYALCAVVMLGAAGLFIVSQRLRGLEPAPQPAA